MKALAYFTILVVFLLLLINTPYAKELVKEMSMVTEAGEIVLTSEECLLKKEGLQGYDYAAYATDKGHPNHQGCWKSDS